MRMCMASALGRFLLVVGVGLVSALYGQPVAAQDSNLHTLTGDLVAVRNTWYPGTGEWISEADVLVAAPTQHFSATNRTKVTFTLDGQAIGQAGTLRDVVGLPRKVTVSHWIQGGGIDFINGIVRHAPWAYYIYDRGPAGDTSIDQNLHSIVGTMTAQGCFYFTATADWICGAGLQVAAPAPHFGPGNPATLSVELNGQAIGQAASMNSTLPRKVLILYWLEEAGVDNEHEGVLRSPAKTYYIYDLGPAN